MNERKFAHNLGDRVRDRATGFVGIVNSRAEYRFSTPSYQVTPERLETSGSPDGCWFDEGRLEAFPASGEVAGS